MLYKYVKNEPIQVPKNYLEYEFKRNNTVFSIALMALFIGFSSITFASFPYLKASLYKLTGDDSLNKSILSSTTANDFESSILPSSGSLSATYVSNLYKNLSSTTQELQKASLIYNNEAVLSKSGSMSLTIPSLKLKNLEVGINVNSYNEKDYLPLLDNKLAHFKGTSLPSYPGNTFIYGHSTNELVAKTNPNHPQVAFTFLDKLEIGDEISLEFENTTYKYSVQKSKVVEPEDISSIFIQSDKKTLTLMTCWPQGIGEKRLIIIAEQI